MQHRIAPAWQTDLFRPDGPELRLSQAERQDLISALALLLREAAAVISTEIERHEQDHD